MLSGKEDDRNTADAMSKDVTRIMHAVQADNNPSNGLTIAVANSVWAKPSLPFRKEYVARVHSVLGATAQQLTSASVVNDWCAEQTHGKITTIVDDDTVASMDAILVNALYFKGLWAHQFRKASTQRAGFTLHTGEVVDVAMMSKKFESREIEWMLTEHYGAVRLPYKVRGGFGTHTLFGGTMDTIYYTGWKVCSSCSGASRGCNSGDIVAHRWGGEWQGCEMVKSRCVCVFASIQA